MMKFGIGFAICACLVGVVVSVIPTYFGPRTLGYWPAWVFAIGILTMIILQWINIIAMPSIGESPAQAFQHLQGMKLSFTSFQHLQGSVLSFLHCAILTVILAVFVCF